MKQRFRKADREKIISDWRKCLPAMRVERSMTLAKRNGPILVGLYLQETRGNDSYSVIPFVHNLSRHNNFVTLTLFYPLKNKRNTYHERFTIQSHEREFSDACKRLHKQTLFPLGENLSLSQILGAYEDYIERKISFITDPMYVDPVCYLTWCGKINEAKRLAEKNIKILADWEDRSFLHYGGKQIFLEYLMGIPENPETLREILEDQIKILKIEKLPDYGLIYD